MLMKLYLSIISWQTNDRIDVQDEREKRNFHKIRALDKIWFNAKKNYWGKNSWWTLCENYSRSKLPWKEVFVINWIFFNWIFLLYGHKGRAVKRRSERSSRVYKVSSYNVIIIPQGESILHRNTSSCYRRQSIKSLSQSRYSAVYYYENKEPKRLETR